MRILNIIKMAIVPKLIYRLNTILIKIPASFFGEIDKVILKFMCIHKGPRIPKIILKRKNKVGELTLSDFKLTTKLQKSR